MIWLWVSNLMVLLGAKFNAELQRGRRPGSTPVDRGVPPRADGGGNAERNRRLTLPSLARHRGHSSALTRGVGLYTVSRHVGQFR